MFNKVPNAFILSRGKKKKKAMASTKSTFLAKDEEVGNLMYYYENSLITMGDYDHCCLMTVNYYCKE